MRKTGITLTYLDQRDRTPRHVTADRMSADLNAMHGSVKESGPHVRTFTAPDGSRVTVWWTQDRETGAVTQMFEDTRGLN